MNIEIPFKPEIPMYSQEQKDQVLELLQETGPAHHEAFKEVDGADPEWPIWYAEYIHTKLMDILDLSFTKSELIYLLVAANLDHKDDSPDTPWAEFYRDLILESLS